jgi:hypothetical protein
MITEVSDRGARGSQVGRGRLSSVAVAVTFAVHIQAA